MQTSVAAMAVGREGAIAEFGKCEIVSLACEEANGIKPGRGVTKGTAVGQGLLPDAAADITGGVFEGISAWVPGREPGGSSGEYEDEETMPVVKRGVVWVYTEDAVTYGSAAYCRYVAGVGEEYGTFRSDADTADAAAVPTSRWRTTTTGAGYAKLEINLP